MKYSLYLIGRSDKHYLISGESISSLKVNKASIARYMYQMGLEDIKVIKSLRIYENDTIHSSAIWKKNGAIHWVDPQ